MEIEKYDRVRQIFAETLCVPVDEVTRETTVAEAGADSLDALELQMILEEEFSCDIADDAITFETTVHQLAELIVPHTA